MHKSRAQLAINYMTTTSDKLTPNSSIEDAYRAPSLPDPLPLAHGFKFWFAFAVVVLGHAMTITCFAIAASNRLSLRFLIFVVLGVISGVIPYFLGKRIDARMVPSATTTNHRLILLVSLLIPGTLALILGNYFGNWIFTWLRPITITWPFAVFACLQVLGIITDMWQQKVPQPLYDPHAHLNQEKS